MCQAGSLIKFCTCDSKESAYPRWQLLDSKGERLADGPALRPVDKDCSFSDTVALEVALNHSSFTATHGVRAGYWLVFEQDSNERQFFRLSHTGAWSFSAMGADVEPAV